MDARERELLAGEYVLGTLDAAARRELEADAGMRREIHAWERRLAPLALRVAPVAPRPLVWLNLRHAIGVDATRSPIAPLAQPYRWLRAWAALATAASLVLAFGLYRETNRPAPAPVVVTERVPAPVYVTELAVPKSTMRWTVSIAGRQLAVRASGEAPAAAARRDAELWLVTGSGPVSLGVIPKSGEARRTLAEALTFAGGATLAVSLEPEGGSPTGAPTGPVVSAATLLQAS